MQQAHLSRILEMAGRLHSAIPVVRLCFFIDSRNLLWCQSNIPARKGRNLPWSLVSRARAWPADAVVAHAAARSPRNPDVHRLARAADVKSGVAHGRGSAGTFAYGNDEPPGGISRDIVACTALIARVELGCSVCRRPVAAHAEDAVLRELAVITFVVRRGWGAEAVVE